MQDPHSFLLDESSFAEIDSFQKLLVRKKMKKGCRENGIALS
jgi:hypothetical protein